LAGIGFRLAAIQALAPVGLRGHNPVEHSSRRGNRCGSRDYLDLDGHGFLPRTLLKMFLIASAQSIRPGVTTPTLVIFVRVIGGTRAWNLRSVSLSD
jgi:hypothetical protein